MNNALTTNTEMSLSELGNVLTKSKYFTDASDASQAIVKVLAGRELGIGPIASMTGIHIIKGKPALGANLLASCLKRSGRYDYRVKELTAQNAAIEFFEVIGGKRESLGISAFSITDARAAGTQNIDKFARNMLFARALSNGVRWFCPDVTGGPVYTPEELGAPVNGDGDVIESSAKLVTPEQPKQTSLPPALTPSNTNTNTNTATWELALASWKFQRERATRHGGLEVQIERCKPHAHAAKNKDVQAVLNAAECLGKVVDVAIGVPEPPEPADDSFSNAVYMLK